MKLKNVRLMNVKAGFEDWLSHWYEKKKVVYTILRPFRPSRMVCYGMF